MSSPGERGSTRCERMPAPIVARRQDGHEAVVRDARRAGPYQAPDLRVCQAVAPSLLSDEDEA